MTGRQKE